jgi:nucleoid-associated protein YgaU
MAKPNPQTGHGPLGGTADESSFAHGEDSRGDTEGDGTPEADWDVPAASDNSPLSRILGLILVVVLAGVFSFVAYRKYDEARRHPQDSIVADTSTDGSSLAEPPVGSGATPSGGASRSSPEKYSGLNSSAGAANDAKQTGASADAFQSFDEAAQNRPANGGHHSPQNAYHPVESAAVAQTASSPNPPVGREADANPFGDLGSTPAGRAQMPKQTEPPPQMAAGAPSGSAGKAEEFGGPQASGQAVANTAGPGGVSPAAGTAHLAPAGADADMQNLFPGEGTAKADRPMPGAQNVAGRGTPPDATGLTRTAAAHVPPTQGEPLDNEALDDSHRPSPSGGSDRGGAHNHQSPHGAIAENPGAGVPNSGRAEALLGDQERQPIGGNELDGRPARHDAGVSQSPSERPAASATPLQASSANSVRAGDLHSSSQSNDPFSGNHATARAGFGDNSGTAAGLESSTVQPTRTGAALGTVSPVGTASDTGDYYVVQPQDNFWSISRKKYGTSRYFHALAELNKARIPDPGRMRPGMKVSTPPAEVLEERYGQFLPPGTKVQVTSAEEISAKSAPTGFIVSADGTPKYRTGDHDTLSDIAAKHLGRSSRWIQIYEMNRDKLSSPNQLKVGIELALPGDASNVAVSTEDDERR